MAEEEAPGTLGAAARGHLGRTWRAAAAHLRGSPSEPTASSPGPAGGRRRVSELRVGQGRGGDEQRPVSPPLGPLSLVLTASVGGGSRPQPVTVAARPACPSGGRPCLSLGQLSGLCRDLCPSLCLGHSPASES